MLFFTDMKILKSERFNVLLMSVLFKYFYVYLGVILIVISAYYVISSSAPLNWTSGLSRLAFILLDVWLIIIKFVSPIKCDGLSLTWWFPSQCIPHSQLPKKIHWPCCCSVYAYIFSPISVKVRSISCKHIEKFEEEENHTYETRIRSLKIPKEWS